MIVMEVGQKKALNVADTILSQIFNCGCSSLHALAINKRVKAFPLDLGFQDDGVTEADVEYVDSKHLMRI